jgi:hypothetical protein
LNECYNRKLICHLLGNGIDFLGRLHRRLMFTCELIAPQDRIFHRIDAKLAMESKKIKSVSPYCLEAIF